MDQVKIGKFIAELRKEQNLTQAQLGERLGVTNKTVSRWENGNYMPELALIPDLAAQLGISVNELIAGERFMEAEYKRNADEQLLKNMQLIEEIREIKDSRWLSQGMGEVGLFMFLSVFLGLIAHTMGVFYNDMFLYIGIGLGLAVIAGGTMLVMSVKKLGRLLHISTVLGIGLMFIFLGFSLGEQWLFLIPSVNALLLVSVGMLGNRIYFRAIDKLLEENVKIEE